jgi:hypothetical protein
VNRHFAPIALATLVACGPAIPPLPSQGGPAWHEFTTEHFTLWTDTSATRARELMREMEDLRHVVIGIAFHGGGEGRVLVIALRDDAEVRAFLPGDFKAIASDGTTAVYQPMIMIPADSYSEVVAHELTHTISQTVIPKQPRWFAEGLAKYFETIKIDRGRGTVDLGRAPTYRGEPMVMSRLMSLGELVACKELTCADAHFYAAAWALFTYLMNEKRAEVTSYIQLLATANLDELEADVKRWLVSGRHTVLHYNVKLPTYAVTERELGDADVRAARALLRLEFQGNLELAKLEADAALAIDPTHVVASLVRYRADKSITADAARALVKAHPDDWRAHMLLAWIVRTGEEAAAAYKRGCELAAQNPALDTPCPPK